MQPFWRVSLNSGGYQSSEPQIIARELANRDTAHQFHVAFQFSFHQAKCPLDPSLAGGSQGIEIIAADPDRLGADRERLEDMRPALHPAVHEPNPVRYTLMRARRNSQEPRNALSIP